MSTFTHQAIDAYVPFFLPLLVTSSLLAAACLHYLVEKPFLLRNDRI